MAKDVYVGGTKVTPKPATKSAKDSRAALNKLTSGGTLTPEERKILNIAPAPYVPPVAPKEEPLPDMPSALDMLAAEGAYKDALTYLNKEEFPKAGTIIRYDAGPYEGTFVPVYADGKGGETVGTVSINPVNPGSTGNSITDTGEETKVTLAKDTFANTIALTFGAQEAAQPWVNEIYSLASGFYNTGSTIDESLNLSLYDAKEKGLAPQFTKRFKGVFDLQKKLQKGETVTVPTIAEFIKAEVAIGDVLREAGLGDIANRDFIGDVIGLGNSVLDVGKLISDTFNVIDNAPKALRQTLDTYFPSVDRASLAKALLTGTEGAAALEKKVKGISVLSAAGSQGINTDITKGGLSLADAGDIAARGFNYEQSLQGFGQVKDLQRAGMLGKTQGTLFTQEEATGLVFGQDQTAKEKAERIRAAELAKFQGGAGLSASALRGQNAKQVI